MTLRPMETLVAGDGSILWMGEAADGSRMSVQIRRIDEWRFLPALWELKGMGVGANEAGPSLCAIDNRGVIRFSFVIEAAVRFLVDEGWNPELESVFRQIREQPAFPVANRKLDRLDRRVHAEVGS